MCADECGLVCVLVSVCWCVRCVRLVNVRECACVYSLPVCAHRYVLSAFNINVYKFTINLVIQRLSVVCCTNCVSSPLPLGNNPWQS